LVGADQDNSMPHVLHMKLKWKTWSLLQLETSPVLVTISLTSYHNVSLCSALPPSATRWVRLGVLVCCCRCCTPNQL